MKIIETIKNILLPQNCLLCQKLCGGAIALCEICQRQLPLNNPSCQGCGIPLQYVHLYCGACLKKPLPFRKVIAPFQYEFPITHLVSKLKFQHELIAASTLGSLFAKTFKEDTLPECIIPIPLHIKRLKERGFNQSMEIARPIARHLNIPIIHNACWRVKETKPQAQLNAENRIQNIKNAFLVNTHFSFKHIALLDDVITTGNTAAELTRSFKKAGVEKIEVWGCARATMKEKT